MLPIVFLAVLIGLPRALRREKHGVPSIPAAIPDAVDCEPSGGWMFRIVAGSLFTFGVAGLVWWLAYRRLPRRLDREAMTLRNGEVHRWSDVVKVVHKKKVHALVRSAQLDYHLEITFRTGRVWLNPGTLENGLAAIHFVERRLQVDAEPHLAPYQRVA